MRMALHVLLLAARLAEARRRCARPATAATAWQRLPAAQALNGGLEKLAQPRLRTAAACLAWGGLAVALQQAHRKRAEWVADRIASKEGSSCTVP